MRTQILSIRAALVLLLPCLVAGCSINVNKGKNGEDKDVDLHMLSGGLHVQQGAPSAAELQLPTYPGATTADDKDSKSANVQVGFGDWQIKVLVAKYQTPDAQAKVVSFYRSALGHLGDVIECRNGHAVGAAATHEGLGCDDKHFPGAHISGDIHIDDDDNEFSLRAGSRRHQHIVAFKAGAGSGTRFTLLRLDLPSEGEKGDKEQ